MKTSLGIGLFLWGSAWADGFRVTGLSLGFGDWITVTDGDWKTREHYGTLPGMGVYYSALGWQGSLSLPVKSAAKPKREETRYALGDGEITLGKRLGKVTPRMALRFPLYAWSVEDASVNELFIGSGNVNLALGLNAKAPAGLLPSAWTAAADIEISTAVTEALAAYGSSHAMGIIQISYALGKRWKVGANSLFLFDAWKWIPPYWDQDGETKFSILPGAVAGVRLFRASYFDAKAGLSVYDARALDKPKFAFRPQQSFYYSLSLFQGF